MNGELTGVALRLHGPLQSWGGASIGDNRPTHLFPTRSGVLGLVACCLGIGRRDVARLLALAQGTRVHVRVDAAGTALVDDQTIQDNPNASGTRQTIQSKRTYLCDASFVAVVVPGEGITTEAIASAVTSPVFAPYLGRRSCVPSTPLLASPEVSAADAIAMFDSIPRGPAEVIDELERHHSMRTGRSVSKEGQDFYLDVDHHPAALRQVAMRDHFVGPLPRQWRERFAWHVRVPLRTS